MINIEHLLPKVDWEKPDYELARQFKVPQDKIARVRKKVWPVDHRLHKTKHKPYDIERKDYSHFDWQLTDAQLGRQHNLSRERVRQVRQMLKAPASPRKGYWSDCTPRSQPRLERHRKLLNLSSNRGVAFGL